MAHCWKFAGSVIKTKTHTISSIWKPDPHVGSAQSGIWTWVHGDENQGNVPIRESNLLKFNQKNWRLTTGQVDVNLSPYKGDVFALNANFLLRILISRAFFRAKMLNNWELSDFSSWILYSGCWWWPGVL